VSARRERATSDGESSAASHRDLYLAGSGSFGVEAAEWASDAGWRVLGLLELIDGSRVGMSTDGHPIISPDAPPAEARAVIALGGDRRAHWAQLERHRWQAATIVHPGAHVSPTARLQAGCIVGPGAVIGAETIVGAHTLVSRGVLVGHHAHVGAFVSLFPGANLGGHVKIGDRAAVGMGAVVVNGMTVGDGTTVAAGAIVVRDLAPGIRAQGIPARKYPE
jgi:sugar O-acyltransferase (sialic acid O-acetyltransferase NeuD family)